MRPSFLVHRRTMNSKRYPLLSASCKASSRFCKRYSNATHTLSATLWTPWALR